MEEEFNNLNINLDGITWNQFGNADRVDIDDLLDTLNIHGRRRIVVVDLWKRHPNQKSQQGKM
jgi:hypothetical protein